MTRILGSTATINIITLLLFKQLAPGKNEHFLLHKSLVVSNHKLFFKKAHYTHFSQSPTKQSIFSGSHLVCGLTSEVETFLVGATEQ